MEADPRVLTDVNITNHASMPVRDNCSCPLATIFFGSIVPCTVLTSQHINTSAGDFSPNAEHEVDLHPSKKFCSPFLASRRIFQSVHLPEVVRGSSDALDRSLLAELPIVD
ncbi:unnamed protein product [Hymenolepis diminuta]|uniref:Uncharacterized protein n=1 Tax=Hymenolepis diminuta TaxID=6216 RepID=A0A0R3SA32_HYMDI|nr:unnamed protein product [Hymenolepis diminuta]VUZ41459.1 unnamed protein product [Hymenolepis diminuta]VUZ43041.1 unnamed protein product [Hymenolepis diminuta]